MRLRSNAAVVIAMVVAGWSAGPASAQDAGEPAAASTTPTSTPPPSTAPTRSERARSESGGSTAVITRGSDPSTAPVRDRRDGELAEERPVHEEDDGRKADFIWLEVEGGVSYADLIAFRQENFSGPAGETVTTPGFEDVTGVGPMVGVGVGFRVFFFAAGARATFASYGAFDIGTVGGEVQFRLPTPIVEPWIRLGAGYAWMGNASYTAPIESATTVYGWMLNGAIGLDFFVTWWLSLGVGASLDVLNMTRQVDIRQECMRPDEFCPTQNGDAVGAQARGFAQVGLHF